MSEWWSPPLGGIVHADAVPTMRPMVKDMWVAALRSGIYPQNTIGRLRTEEDEFCPLGVLADLAVKLKVCTWERLDGRWFIPPYLEASTLPHSVFEWAGFTGMHISQLVPLTYDGHKHPIWRINDTLKVPFADIAQLIEAQY